MSQFCSTPSKGGDCGLMENSFFYLPLSSLESKSKFHPKQYKDKYVKLKKKIEQYSLFVVAQIYRCIMGKILEKLVCSG